MIAPDMHDFQAQPITAECRLYTILSLARVSCAACKTASPTENLLGDLENVFETIYALSSDALRDIELSAEND